MAQQESYITHLFFNIEEVIVWMEFQKEMCENQAKAADTKRSKAICEARAGTWGDAAYTLRHSWIDEIDGDRHTATERGRKQIGDKA